ncbi:hypothetical protein R1sor_001044 [Riccia sorocarpa]|uniref:CHAT domain-containing protein n=1 Tax=Riccia sorocarpa TaxID=122646 RepID=A0ABD3GXA5_9MARC
MNFADWEAAVFNYEWCKELLRLTMETHKFEIQSETYDWLLVWLDVPLVEMYEFRKMDFRRALDLRTEMWSKVPADLSDVSNNLKTLEMVALYQCAVADYPEVKHEVLKIVSECFNFDSCSSAEEEFLLLLHRRNHRYGNLEASCSYLDHLDRHLASAASEKSEHLEQRPWILEVQLGILFKLGRIGEVQALIQNFQRRTNKKKKDLPKALQYFLTVCERQDMRLWDQNILTESQKLRQDIQDTLGSSTTSKLFLELEQLRQEAEALWNSKEWDKAVECYETCLEKMDQPGWYSMKIHDYVRMGVMHFCVWCKKGSGCGETIWDFQEDENFSRAVLYFEKCNELPSHQREIIQIVFANYALVVLYARVDDKYYFQLGDTAASLFSDHGSSSNSSSNKRASDAEVKAMREYIAFPNKMVYYGKVASGYVTGPLYTMTNRMSSEAWITTLQQVHDMYVALRTYFCRRVNIATALRSWDDLDQDVEDDRWAVLTYTERERSRVMLYQTESNMLNNSASRKLWHFDVDDSIAAAAIRQDCATLLQADAVFVQYSNLSFGDILISVLDQKGNLRLSTTSRFRNVKDGVPLTKTVQDRLRRLYSLLDPKDPRKPVKHMDDRVNRELEFLYDVLIQPITIHLQKMKPEQKLIISTNEDLAIVPFPALKDRRTGEFLIQRHTIGYTSSMRVLKVCSERLHELQSSHANIGLGSVVALGNPSYNVCENCPNLGLLQGTAKEVEHIANLFGEMVVVKLLRERATTEQLRHWTARPDSENIRQALVHIGSHAKASDYSTNPSQNVLHLACPSALFNDEPTTGTTERRSPSKQGREHLGQEADEYSHEEASNFDKEFESTRDESSGEDVTDFEEELTAMMKKLGQLPDYDTGQSCGRRTGNLVSDQDFMIIGTSRSGGESSADDKPHDLKAEDIRTSDPRWKAELVVLNACSTSRGRLTSVEGVLSLARAFLIAGVPCTVASLWKVDDIATANLMARFYDELSKGNDVATALRCAMLQGLREHEVKNWAPFVVRVPHGLQRHG